MKVEGCGTTLIGGAQSGAYWLVILCGGGRSRVQVQMQMHLPPDKLQHSTNEIKHSDSPSTGAHKQKYTFMIETITWDICQHFKVSWKIRLAQKSEAKPMFHKRIFSSIFYQSEYMNKLYQRDSKTKQEAMKFVFIFIYVAK